MNTISGTNNRILEINLSTRESEIVPIPPEERKKYIGGKGLALKLLFDRLTPGTDPLGEENIFIVTTGVLIGTGAPNSARFSAVSKSPLTGIISHSSCGGPFGNALKTSGWDGLILKGKSDSPVFLNINSNGVEFSDAGDLWGETTSAAESRLEPLGKGALVIGPAGENRVRFANIASGGRYLGRGGLGAVLGSKKVKGIVARGNEYRIRPKDPETFKKFSSRGFRYIRKNHFTGHRYNRFGTLMHLSTNNGAGIMPVNNFNGSSSENGDLISGEHTRETRNTKYESCRNCTILCGHSGEFNGKRTSVPEYETTSLLGSNLGIFDMDRISRWNDLCGEMGLDTISTGGTIAWVMEAAEKGLLSSNLGFGNPEGISEVIEDISFRRGFGEEMAGGSRKLAEKYGGEEFCMAVKGLEMSAYHPEGSAGMGLNFAIANRGGCHLSSTVFGLEIDIGLIPPLTTMRKAAYVEIMENIFAGINSLHTCHFTVYAYILESPRLKYIPKPLVKLFLLLSPSIAKLFLDVTIYSGLFSSVTGEKLSAREFTRAGKRIHTLERLMNTREGIRAGDDRLPGKILARGIRGREGKPYPLAKMVRKYYMIRKYDRNGIPRKSQLKRLGITGRGTE